MNERTSLAVDLRGFFFSIEDIRFFFLPSSELFHSIFSFFSHRDQRYFFCFCSLLLVFSKFSLMILRYSRRLLCSTVRPIFVANGAVAYKLNIAAKKLPLAQTQTPAAGAPGTAVLELTYPTSSTSSAKPQTKAHSNPQMLMVYFPATGQRAAVFPEGSIVGFGFADDLELEIVRRVMHPFEESKDPLMVPETPVSISSQRYCVASDASAAPSFAVDAASGALLLPSDSANILAPCAMCLVELVQLRALGTLLAPVARDTSRWRNSVIGSGKLPFSLKQARKRKAQVMRIGSRQMKIASVRHQVFWDSHHAESRQAFTLACEHFELATAHSELRERVDAVAQTLVYLSEEAHADTNHRLEWVIIVLISLEVVISLLTHRD
jgi:hypothetical protein